MIALLTLITTGLSKLSASIAIAIDENKVVNSSSGLKSKLSKSKNLEKLSKSSWHLNQSSTVIAVSTHLNAIITGSSKILAVIAIKANNNGVVSGNIRLVSRL